MKYIYSFAFVLFCCISCNTQIDSSTYADIKKDGKQISDNVQAVLLQNVGQAIQKEGVPYAVEFCNLNAASIVDSLNHKYDCTITRISEKNRNPEAGLSSQKEKELWQLFAEQKHADTLIQINNSLVYYKPIKIALPACLKCHGNTNSDINSTTYEKLHSLYPNDLATGYKLNDFRGLWKIEFEEKE